MLKELYTAAMGMIPQQTRLEVTANNIANANTTGFKSESVFVRNLIDARDNLFNVPGDIEQDDPPIGSYIDFSDGAYRQTENPLDVAIEGKGFFALHDESGGLYYSRSGHFQLSTDGRIINNDGMTLLGQNGEISIHSEYLSDPMITNDTKALDLKITESGDIFMNDFLIDRIALYDIANPESLRRVSNQNFIISDETLISNIPNEEVQIRQGWLEGSNVNIIKEMISMIELQRMFEAGTKVIQTNDRTLDSSLKIGSFF